MILLVSTCAEALHELEFVRPVQEILGNLEIQVRTVHYSEISDEDLQSSQATIICGTSLQDNEYLDHLDAFQWIQQYGKPLLGICAGMQVLGLTFGGELKNATEIGFYKEEFTEELWLRDAEEVYHLHTKWATFEGFEILSKGDIPQAVRRGALMGVLFHPEVRQQQLVREFAQHASHD